MAEAIRNKDFPAALKLRDPEFRASLIAFMDTRNANTPSTSVKVNYVGLTESLQLTFLPHQKPFTIAIVHTGAPAGGMNMATRVAIRLAIIRGHRPFVIHNGFAGLIAGDVRGIEWKDTEDWVVEGGSNLGTNRSLPSQNIGICAWQLQRFQIQSLIVVGGFEGYTAVNELADARSRYPAFCIPIVLIPATISNNVPGTEFSIGSDTAVNVIVESCDRVRQSAFSSRNRVFVVEVQGGHCGYLATMGGLAHGATLSYIPEEGIDLAMIAKDCQHLIRRFSDGNSQGRVVLRCEQLSKTYTTEIITSIFKDEGAGLFDSRSSVLGHIQQGGSPSPLDRIRAARMAEKCILWLEDRFSDAIQLPKSDAFPRLAPVSPVSPLLERKSVMASGTPYTNSPNSCCVIGVRGTGVVFTPVSDLKANTDVDQRKSLQCWWLHLNKLTRILAKYEI